MQARERGLLTGFRPAIHPDSTAIGVVIASAALQTAALVSPYGEIVVFGGSLTGLGAIVLTYYGIERYRPDPLPDIEPEESPGIGAGRR